MSAAAHHRARLLVGLLILLGAHLLLAGYVTDDTYIHLRYAENVATRGEFAFNPGEATYGATSPLWIFGLVLLLKLHLAPEVAAWTLGLLAGTLTVGLWAGLLRRLPLPEGWRWWLLVVGVVDAWFLRWTMSGMETPLASAALLILMWPVVLPFQPEPAGSGPSPVLWRRYLAWGAAAGLSALVRPEYLLLAPLALPWLLWTEYQRADQFAGRAGRTQARPQHLLPAALLGWLATAGPWLVYARVTFGRITPGTASAKSNALSFHPLEFAGYALRSLEQIGLTQGILWLFLVLVAVMVLVGRRRPDMTAEVEAATPPTWTLWQSVALVGIPVTWAAVVIGGYALTRVWVISRYLAPLSMPLLLVLAAADFWLLRAAEPFRGQAMLRRWGWRSAMTLTIAANVILLVGLVRPHARDFSAGMRGCYLAMGQWIGENSAPGDVVAALDIGALAHGSDRPVLDLMGLVSPQIMSLGRQMGFESMVRSGAWLRPESDRGQRPDWFVDRTDGPPRWDGKVVRGVHFALVDTCVIHGVGLTERQDWTVALYRLSPVSSP